MKRLLLLSLQCAVLFGPALSAGNDTIVNPVLAGFYPDPSICRVGGDYYIVNSSFSYFPGLPVFHSTDLAHWSLIGHVMDRPEQLNLDSLGVSRGLFAPAIRYHDGRFFVTCTLVDRGGNFVVTSTSAAGPWSDPIWLPRVNGIDPSLFFDTDGKCYILYNSVAPDNRPLYDGHRTIRLCEFDARRLAMTGDERILVNGGTDLRTKPVWIEGPHLFRKEGMYYLIAAEGGTGDWHSEVVFRSRTIDGPYEPWGKNPILTQRDLSPERENPITCTGHADFVETGNGDWWAVFLGCRPYRPYAEGFYNTGRETFIAPVRWEGGWPLINPGHAEVQFSYTVDVRPAQTGGISTTSGNFTFRDDFAPGKLRPGWSFLRTPREKWYSLTDRPGYCSLRVRPEECSRPVNPSFIGWRQSHQRCAARASLDFTPASENEKAGILIFHNERHFYFLCKSLQDGTPVIQLYRSTDTDTAHHAMELLASGDPGVPPGTPVLLKVEARGESYSFHYGSVSGGWHLLRDDVPAKFLSTKVAGGFVGCMYALYATSLGSPGGNRAYFDWFEYSGDDEVYR